MDSTVLGIVIGVLIFATAVLSWQLFVTFRELSELLRSMKDLTRQVQTDLNPTLKEVNELLEKVNQTMDGVQQVGHKLQGAQKTLAKGWVNTKRFFCKVGRISQDTVTIFSAGLATGRDVWMSQNSQTLSPPVQSEAEKSLSL